MNINADMYDDCELLKNIFVNNTPNEKMKYIMVMERAIRYPSDISPA